MYVYGFKWFWWGALGKSKIVLNGAWALRKLTEEEPPGLEYIFKKDAPEVRLTRKNKVRLFLKTNTTLFLLCLSHSQAVVYHERGWYRKAPCWVNKEWKVGGCGNIRYFYVVVHLIFSLRINVIKKCFYLQQNQHRQLLWYSIYRIVLNILSSYKVPLLR